VALTELFGRSLQISSLALSDRFERMEGLTHEDALRYLAARGLVGGDASNTGEIMSIGEELLTIANDVSRVVGELADYLGVRVERRQHQQTLGPVTNHQNRKGNDGVGKGSAPEDCAVDCYHQCM